MRRWMSMAVACVTIGCSKAPAEPESPATLPDAYAGQWRSVTPSLEFVRLSVASTSSEMGVLAARLAFSGVALDGRGRIVGDSLVMGMSVIGTTVQTRTLVAHASDARTLRVQVRADAGAPLDLTFVRDD